MDVFLKEVGERICERRKNLGYTQEQLAERMDVSIQMISNLERGNKAIKIDNLLKLSKILSVSTDYILTGIQACYQLLVLLFQLRHSLCAAATCRLVCRNVYTLDV